MKYGAIFYIVFASMALAQAEVSQPLTLAKLLKHAEEDLHPRILVAIQGQKTAQSQLGISRSVRGLHTNIFADLSYIQPSNLSTNQEKEDYVLGISITRRLIDFGQTRYQILAEQENVKIAQYQLAQARNQFKLLLMRRYFDVILADLQYRRDNEAMANAYVRFDQAQQLRAVGKLSDVKVLQLQARYQETLKKRMRSESLQNQYRLILASTMGMTEIPAKLKIPRLKYLSSPVPEFEKLYEIGLKQNRRLQIVQANLLAAQNKLISSRRTRLPTIDIGVEAWQYNRQLANRDEWRAGLRLNWPVLQGKRIGNEIDLAKSQVVKYQSELELLRQEIRSVLYEYVNQLSNLKYEKQELEVLKRYRELRLDKNRALYELEVKTDLGIAMTQISDTEWRIAKNLYEKAILIAKISATIGQPIQLKELHFEKTH